MSRHAAVEKAKQESPQAIPGGSPYTYICNRRVELNCSASNHRQELLNSLFLQPVYASLAGHGVRSNRASVTVLMRHGKSGTDQLACGHCSRRLCVVSTVRCDRYACQCLCLREVRQFYDFEAQAKSRHFSLKLHALLCHPLFTLHVVR